MRDAQGRFQEATSWPAAWPTKDDRVRYEAALRLGEIKAYWSYRHLRRVADDARSPEYVRLAAARSLAQLGEPDALRLLCTGATADGFMARHMASIGLEVISGKNLDDFEGYRYGEGAFVSGGNEMMTPLDAVDDAEKKAKRFAAAYFRWLKAERPDLYKHVAPAW